MWETILIYIIGGCFAGFAAGLLGIGGGIIVVPFLAFVLPHIGVAPNIVMHVAVATSLAIICGTSISSMIAHNRHGGVLWDVVKVIIWGLILGAFVGAHIADLLTSSVLRIVFGVFMLLMAFNMVFNGGIAPHREMPGKKSLALWGAGIAGFCALLGTGGGSLLVPFFTWRKMPIRNAVATSAVCGFPIALVAAVGYIMAGLHEPGLPPHTLGYVYLPAFIAIVIPSILLAPVGATIAHKISTKKLKVIFALFLLLVGADMLNKAIADGWHWIIGQI